jgi:hypothetical protein
LAGRPFASGAPAGDLLDLPLEARAAVPPTLLSLYYFSFP